MGKQEQLFRLLQELNIKTKTYSHEPVYTVEQAKLVTSFIPAGQVKNLFLKDDKKRLLLIVACADTQIQLKNIAKKFGLPGLRFASPELLQQVLGVEPGSVTPFALINDESGTVTVLLDVRLFNYDCVGFHPLKNDATTTINPHDLKRLIEHWGNKIFILEEGAEKSRD